MDRKTILNNLLESMDTELQRMYSYTSTAPLQNKALDTLERLANIYAIIHDCEDDMWIRRKILTYNGRKTN